MADISAGFVTIATELFGLVFLVQGVIALAVMTLEESRVGVYADAIKAIVLLTVGILILRSAFYGAEVLSWLFALGFCLDALSRLATVAVVRFRRWGHAVVACTLELILAGLLIADWPLRDAQNISLCISLLLVLSGCAMVRIAHSLARLHEATAIYSMPLFCDRGWNEETAVFIHDNVPDHDDVSKMRVLVWTPAAVAEVLPRRPIIDRYLATRDTNGKVQTGHAALEVQPDIYISHWPMNDIDPAAYDFAGVFYSGAANDLPGLFQPSYDEERLEWMAADQEVVFTNFHILRLRAYWEGYRQHATYNVTNRNCSIAVAGALEAALEGSLDCRRPWLRLGLLLLNPRLWEAAYIRSRAVHLCWTPGMTLDYAKALKRIVEPQPAHWPSRLLLRLCGGLAPGIAEARTP